MSDVNINVERDDKCKAPQEWEIEDAVRILVRAEEIKKDSELMKLVQPKLEKMKKAVISAADILYKGEEKNEG